MTEIFYYNASKELQQLKLYNIDGGAFVDSTNCASFKIFCVLEDGSLQYISPEFSAVDADLSDALQRMLC